MRKFVGQVTLNLLAIRLFEVALRSHRRRADSFDPYWDDE